MILIRQSEALHFMSLVTKCDYDSVWGYMAGSRWTSFPRGVMSMRNERCLAIPISIFSRCPNKKHIYKYSFALPSMYDNPIHFGQSICSVYTHRLRWGTKGPLWPLAGVKPQADEWPCTLHSLRGLVLLTELHHWALPAWENHSVKNWKIHWFEVIGFSNSLLTG